VILTSNLLRNIDVTSTRRIRPVVGISGCEIRASVAYSR